MNIIEFIFRYFTFLKLLHLFYCRWNQEFNLFPLIQGNSFHNACFFLCQIQFFDMLSLLFCYFYNMFNILAILIMSIIVINNITTKSHFLSFSTMSPIKYRKEISKCFLSQLALVHLFINFCIKKENKKQYMTSITLALLGPGAPWSFCVLTG